MASRPLKPPPPRSSSGDLAGRRNAIYIHDNLPVMEGMNSDSVDLIYLDPPFNSKRLYSAPVGSKAAGAEFKDTWTWQDVSKERLDELVGLYPQLARYIASVGAIHSKAMQAYLMYMTQRIVEMHRVLKPTGSLYLHCDPTASHYLKVVLDRVFGSRNFRNEITWKRYTGSKTRSLKPTTLGASKDCILVYAKNKTSYIRGESILLKSDALDAKFKLTDDKGPYYLRSAFNPKGLDARPNQCFEYKGFAPPHPSGWVCTQPTLEQMDALGEVVFEYGKQPRRKQRPRGGVVPSDIWDDIPPTSATESTGYPTQKPLELLERIVLASTDEGDVVLDPFCGCATTMVAASKLKRGWIGIDVSDTAAMLVTERLKNLDMFSRGAFDVLHDPPIRTDKQLTKMTTAQARPILLRENRLYECPGCGQKHRRNQMDVDHIRPKAAGGVDALENYQVLCHHCNILKGKNTMAYLRARIKQLQEDTLGL